eukprot:280678-Prorocentrum_minimum.AAC.1
MPRGCLRRDVARWVGLGVEKVELRWDSENRVHGRGYPFCFTPLVGTALVHRAGRALSSKNPSKPPHLTVR